MRTRGMAYLGLFEFVKQKFGEQALMDLLEGIVEFPEIFIRDIDAYHWYPIDIFTEALEYLVSELGNGDMNLARQLGRLNCDLYIQMHPIEKINPPSYRQEIIKTLNRLWMTYHDYGRFVQQGNMVFKLSHPITPAHTAAIAGFAERYIEIIGLKKYRVDTTISEPGVIRLRPREQGAV